ncbi:hypothetical protein U0070_001115 [Myodes glareolus]|uniref:Uncharacterized protein n=1 Tax=Myodes glareolus TaxID=447135 RepID=A0AAW0IWY7_MYOGA
MGNSTSFDPSTRFFEDVRTESEETKTAEMLVPALNLVLCSPGASHAKDNAKRPEDREASKIRPVY